MKKMALALAVAASALVGGTAGAEVIDFAKVATGTAATSVTVGDYVLSYLYGQRSAVFTTNNGFTALGDDLSQFFYGSGFTLTRTDGRAYTLNSLVFGLEGLPGGSRVDVGAYIGGPTVAVLADGQTFTGTAVHRNVTSLTFDAYTTSGAVGIRSLDLSVTGGSAVPEPAAWAMMIVGIGAIGGAMRRRTTAAVAPRLA